MTTKTHPYLVETPEEIAADEEDARQWAAIEADPAVIDAQARYSRALKIVSGLLANHFDIVNALDEAHGYAITAYAMAGIDYGRDQSES